MAVAVGAMDVPAVPGTGVQTLKVTSVPFKPLAVKLFGASAEPEHSEGYFDEWQAFSLGFASDLDDPAEYALIEGSRSVGVHSFQNAGSSNWDDILYASIHTEYATTPDIEIKIRSWDCFGWTFDLIPISGNTPAFRIYYVAYSGITLSRKTGAIVLPASGAGVDVELGFEPQIVEFLVFHNTVRDHFWRMGVATPDFQGFETFHAYEFGSGTVPGNGGGSDHGVGLISDLGGIVTFQPTGFRLDGVPPDDITIYYLALADPDPAAGFWAGSSAWPTTPTDFTTGFQPQAVTALHTGGKNGDRLGRIGHGAKDDQGNSGAIFGQVFTLNPADPIGFIGAGNDKRGEATLTDSGVAVLYQEDGTTLATQDATFAADGFQLSGSDPGPHPEDVLLTAVATSEAPQCESVVSFSFTRSPVGSQTQPR